MPDYKAVLSGQSWNALSSLKANKKPVFLAYTFNGPQRGSTKFDGPDRTMARKTLKMWGDASAIRFLEVEGKDAELKFQWKWEFGDFPAGPNSRNLSGRLSMMKVSFGTRMAATSTSMPITARNSGHIIDTSFNGIDDVDQIVDFENWKDKIVLSSTIFRALEKGD
jgi:hypothetical protein